MKKVQQYGTWRKIRKDCFGKPIDFYKCSNCGCAFSGLHKQCPCCKSENSLDKE